MWRLVLDTNVVLDLLHWHDPAATPLLSALEQGRARWLGDDATLAELKRVLNYPEFALEHAAAALHAGYRNRIEMVAAGDAPRLPRCRDRDDQMFLELAARGGADLLVSRDKALLGLRGRSRLTFRILTPAGAVATLAGEPTPRSLT